TQARSAPPAVDQPGLRSEDPRLCRGARLPGQSRRRSQPGGGRRPPDRPRGPGASCGSVRLSPEPRRWLRGAAVTGSVSGQFEGNVVQPLRILLDADSQSVVEVDVVIDLDGPLRLAQTSDRE